MRCFLGKSNTLQFSSLNDDDDDDDDDDVVWYSAVISMLL